MKQKILSILLIAALLMWLIPNIASAEIVKSGTCGKNLRWMLDSNGTLTISGEGDMSYYSNGQSIPWYSERENVTSTIIENGVTSIASDAFYECINLSSVSISNTVTKIGSYAFNMCESLTNIELSDNITDISASAFYNTAYYQDESNWEDDVLYNGKYLIKAKSSLNGQYDIKKGTCVIATGAFSNCTELTGVSIPNDVTSIKGGTFYNCTALNNIAIPDSIKSISEGAFSDTAYYNDEHNWENGVLYIGKHLVGTDTSVSGSYNIKDDTITIADGAFCYCSELTSINIPNSLISIGNNSFRDSGLININIPDSVEILGSESFMYCYDLTSATIGNGLTSISYMAFYMCENLKSLTIGNGVTNIDEEAFGNCDNIREIYYNGSKAQWNNIDLLDDYLFQPANTVIHCIDGFIGVIWRLDNNGLLTIKCEGDMPNWEGYNTPWEAQKESIINIIVEDGATSIGDYAFGDCYNLTSISIPNSVTSIGNLSFNCCWELSSIDISDNITTIGDNAFYNCVALTNITIPKSVVHIGDGVFLSCENLQEINVDELNENYLSEEGILFNKNKTEIIQYPAKKQLTNYSIPNGVEIICIGAFSAAYNLKELYVPSSVTQILGNAFLGCRSLIVTVDSQNMTYASVDGTLFNKEMTKLISYINKDGISDNYTIPNSVTSIESSAFSECSSLKKINIPNGVTYIGGNAFSACLELDNVVIPEGVTSIGNWTFSNCHKLSNIKIPNSVTSIGYGAFQYCNSLQSITIGNGVINIGRAAFSYCPKLNSVVIPNSVKHIESFVFDNCNKLRDIYYCGTEEEWNAINIEDFNSIIKNATIHYNCPLLITPQIGDIKVAELDNNKYSINVSFSDILHDCGMITVLYGEDEKLSGITNTEITSTDKIKNITVSADEAKTVKVFIWDSLESMVPLCEPKTVTIE